MLCTDFKQLGIAFGYFDRFFDFRRHSFDDLKNLKMTCTILTF